MNIFTQTKQQRPTERGFTLVETLVAISILLISTAGPLTFAQSGLRASFLARDQVGAFYLAQDAIETIKNLRDNQGLDGVSPWLSNLGSCKPSVAGTTVVCNIDTRQTNIQFVSCVNGTNTCSPMLYDPLAHEYVISRSGLNSLNNKSKYTRTIYVTETESDREVQIVVKVDWTSNFFSEKSIVVQENIYNWVPEYQ